MDNVEKAQILLKEIQSYIKDLQISHKDKSREKSIPSKLVLSKKLKQLSCILKEMEILI